MTAMNGIFLSALLQTIWVWNPFERKKPDREAQLQAHPYPRTPPSCKANQCKILPKPNWCAFIPCSVCWTFTFQLYSFVTSTPFLHKCSEFIPMLVSTYSWIHREVQN